MLIITLAFAVALGTPTLAARSGRKLSREPVNDPVKIFFKDCQVETGATRADIESIKMRKLPETKSGRCFLQCIFNKVKIMDDGRFNKHGMVIAFSPAMRGDLTKMGKLKELAEVCEQEIGDRRHKNCNGAKLVVECVARNGKAYGIDFPKSKNI